MGNTASALLRDALDSIVTRYQCTVEEAREIYLLRLVCTSPEIVRVFSDKLIKEMTPQ